MAPLSLLVAKGLGKVAGSFTAVLALLITFGAVQTNIAGFSRMIYSQARAGDFPPIFNKLHQKFQTPSRAMYGLAGVFSLVLLCNGLFNPNLGALLKWPSAIFVASYIVAMASSLKLYPKKDKFWLMAFVALVVCISIYFFSGWAMFYPVVLATIGLALSTRTTNKMSPTKI